MPIAGFEKKRKSRALMGIEAEAISGVSDSRSDWGDLSFGLSGIELDFRDDVVSELVLVEEMEPEDSLLVRERLLDR